MGSEPFMLDDVPWESYEKGTRYGTRFRGAGRFGGGTQIGVSFEILDPGKQAYPTHYHMLEEEHLYILEGKVTLKLGDRTYLLSKGSYVCFPAGQKEGHSISNESDEPCHYLIIGNHNPHDVIIYTDSGRVGVRLTEEGYRQSETMDYWDDIPQ